MGSSVPSPDPPAVLILAAGRGKRLGGQTGAGAAPPKALLRFGGESLLGRHLSLLERVGAGPVHVVVGYEAGQIEAELRRLGRDRSVRLLPNPDWHEGSAVSLAAGAAVLESGRPVLLMDADVLYDHRLLARLLESRHPDCLLLDREIEPGEEPVKVCVTGTDRIVDFAKRPEAGHDWHGESVGFFRLSPRTAAALAATCRAMLEAGGREREYEEPIRTLIRARAPGPAETRFGFEDITGLPWTEIDFMEDVAKAERLLGLLAA